MICKLWLSDLQPQDCTYGMREERSFMVPVPWATRFFTSGPKRTGRLKMPDHVASTRFKSLWAEGRAGSLGVLERGTISQRRKLRLGVATQLA